MELSTYVPILSTFVALSGVLTTIGIFILKGITRTTQVNSTAITAMHNIQTDLQEKIAKNYYDKVEVDQSFAAFGKRSEQRMELILESINLRLTHLEASYHKTEDGISGLRALLPELVETLKDLKHKNGK